jgi:hypothetical protein
MPFTLNLRLLYRGTGASVLNEMQMMAIQFGLTRMFQRLYGHAPGQDSSAQQLMGASLCGGMVAALVASPIELIMIQQQRQGGSLLGTVTRVARLGVGSSGVMRGVAATMARDGIYVSGLLGITPVVQKYCTDRGMSTPKASFVGSIVGGTLCSLVSHPADIVKTCMQGDLQQQRFSTATSTLALLWREGGARRIYSGAAARCLNITMTIYVANESVIR